MPALILFWILAIVCVGAAITMVSSTNPVRSALALVACFLGLAVYYITLSAQFIGAVQVVVYAGAVMVLFLFVIMLLNLGAPVAKPGKNSLQGTAAVVLGAVLLLALFVSGMFFEMPGRAASAATAQAQGTVKAVGLTLYSPSLPWLFPFEATSLLLLVTVVGAIVMTRRQV